MTPLTHVIPTTVVANRAANRSEKAPLKVVCSLVLSPLLSPPPAVLGRYSYSLWVSVARGSVISALWSPTALF